MYDRDGPRRLAVVDQHEAGVGWQAAAGEGSARTSHALRTAAGVWVLDPLDAPGLDDRLAELGPVAGVAVLADYHARDAARVAARHDVPVTVPSWCDRGARQVRAADTAVPVERATDRLAGGPKLLDPDPLLWSEACLHDPVSGTLYVPGVLGTAGSCAGTERLGLMLPDRLWPPRDPLGGLTPDRVVVGHGTGVHEAATEALQAALDGARRRLPRALVECGPAQLRGMLGAVR